MKNLQKKTLLKVGFTLFICAISACGDDQKSNQEHPDTRTDKNNDHGMNRDLDDESVTFEIWCERAAETEVAKTVHKKYFQLLCVDGKPTELFRSTLLQEPYDGSNSVKLTTIEEPVHDSTKKLTSMTLGTAIKLPIDIATHFDKVGPKNGDEQELIAAGKDQDAEVSVKFLKKFTTTSDYQVRGWLYDIKTVKKFAGLFSIENTAKVRADQWMLVEGSAYLYTSYYTEAGTGIIYNDLFTAGIKINGASYLISIGYVQTDDKGFSDLAVETINETAQQIAKTNYESALKVK